MARTYFKKRKTEVVSVTKNMKVDGKRYGLKSYGIQCDVRKTGVFEEDVNDSNL